MGKTPYERRFGKPFKGPIIPLWFTGWGITLFSAKDQSRIHLWERKSYLDCSSDTDCTRVYFGRVTYWLQTLRSWRRWTHRKSTSKKTQCERGWYFPQNGFSSHKWTNQTSWRRSRPENIHLDTGSSNSRRKSRWFSRRIRRVSSTTSRLISGCWVKRWMISGPYQETSYTVITLNQEVKLYSPREEPFPVPLRYIDVSRTTDTNLDVKQQRRIDDYWNVDGVKRFVWFLDNFHSVHSIRRETSRRIYVVQVRDWRGKQLTSRPDFLWPELWERSHEKPQIDNARKLRGIYVIDPEDKARNWKHQWLSLCLARSARTIRIAEWW